MEGEIKPRVFNNLKYDPSRLSARVKFSLNVPFYMITAKYKPTNCSTSH
jgi:hypothetical protein